MRRTPFIGLATCLLTGMFVSHMYIAHKTMDIVVGGVVVGRMSFIIMTYQHGRTITKYILTNGF